MKKKIFNRALCIISSFLLLIPLCSCFGLGKPDTDTSDDDSNITATTTDVPSDTTTSDVTDKDKDTDKDEDNGNYITVDYVFYSEKKDDIKLNIPKTIEKDGKTYEYTGNAEYVLSETMECVEYSTELQVEDKDEAEDTITYTSPKTGKKYVLKAGTFNWSDLTKIKKTVTERVDYTGYMSKPDIPDTKTLTYVNKDTKEEEEVEGKLSDWGASEKYWAKAEEPIIGTFERDASDYTAFGTDIWENDVEWKVRVDLDNNYPSWDGYEKDVLKIARVPENDMDDYRIVGADWTSDKYYDVVIHDDKEVVVERRDASYMYEAKVQDYWAEYVGYGESIGYKTFVSYFATVDEVLEFLKKKDKNITKDDIKDDIKILYKMKATATFKEVQ